jgi:hypothetical protein
VLLDLVGGDLVGQQLPLELTVDLEVVRVPGSTAPEGGEVLTGTWAGTAEPVVLAVARLR